MLGLEASFANIDDGFIEAVMRSLRKDFLKENDYTALKQTSNISEFKLMIEETGYGHDIFDNQDATGDFEVALLRRAMKEKVAAYFEYFRANAVYPLSAFLEKLLHGYQIDNVVFIIEGLKSNRSLEELMRTADPLGRFPELKNIQPIEGDDYASLYQNVLVDLPVGIYFRKFLNEVTEGAAADDN